MKRKNINIIISVLISSLLFGSCSVGYYSESSRNSATMSPVVYLELSVNDLEFIGEETISIFYRKYVFFNTIDSINKAPYKRRIENKGFFNGMDDIRLSKKLNLASYKVLQDYPDADYFVISSKKKNTQKMFMGKSIKEYATIKAYKFVKNSSK